MNKNYIISLANILLKTSMAIPVTEDELEDLALIIQRGEPSDETSIAYSGGFATSTAQLQDYINYISSKPHIESKLKTDILYRLLSVFDRTSSTREMVQFVLVPSYLAEKNPSPLSQNPTPKEINRYNKKMESYYSRVNKRTLQSQFHEFLHHCFRYLTHHEMNQIIGYTIENGIVSYPQGRGKPEDIGKRPLYSKQSWRGLVEEVAVRALTQGTSSYRTYSPNFIKFLIDSFNLPYWDDTGKTPVFPSDRFRDLYYDIILYK